MKTSSSQSQLIMLNKMIRQHVQQQLAEKSQINGLKMIAYSAVKSKLNKYDVLSEALQCVCECKKIIQ